MISKVYTLPAGTEPTADIVSGLITGSQRKECLELYERLYAYYMNEAVASREAPHQLLAITNHARYIVKTNVGYLLGNPATYLAAEKVDIEPLLDIYRKQTISNLDVENATDTSIFGHAFERIYINKDAETRSTRIDPRNIILVYDDTVQHEKMFAIIYQPSVNEKGEIVRDVYDMTILTPTIAMERKLKDGILSGDEEVSHSFGEVPVVEYLNSSDRVGDFEPVISLLDAYNILQSDRVIDRERLVDAILAFYGMDLGKEDQEDLKESRTIAGIPSDAKIEYIVKNINEADADVLRSAILADIHKISMTPDMSDQNFAGNSSGVALQYKLLAFEQHVKDKERYFENALIDRFRLYNGVLASIKKMSTVEPSEIDIVFRRALPQNDLEASQMINNLMDIVDRETLVSRLSFVQDAKETVKLAQEEQEKALRLGNYGVNKTDEPDDQTDSDDPLDEE